MMDQMPAETGDGREAQLYRGEPEAIPDAMIDGLMDQVRTEGLELLGEDGVLAQLTKRLGVPAR